LDRQQAPGKRSNRKLPFDLPPGVEVVEMDDLPKASLTFKQDPERASSGQRPASRKPPK
jgi:hypothetical protein